MQLYHFRCKDPGSEAGWADVWVKEYNLVSAWRLLREHLTEINRSDLIPAMNVREVSGARDHGVVVSTVEAG